MYFTYLVNFLNFDTANPHSEAYCRRAMDLAESFITPKHRQNMLLEYLPKIIQKFKDICCYRNKSEYFEILIKK